MDIDTPAPGPGIHLDDLEALGEEAALRAMAAHGKEAFLCGEERLYPFPEMTRLAMGRAAEMALRVGYRAWARDEIHDSAADILAKQGREAELAALLRDHPPGPDNPWAGRGLDRLWICCAKQGQLLAMAELAKLSAAPPQAWEQATCLSSLLPMARLHAERAGPLARNAAGEASRDPRAFAALMSTPGLDLSSLDCPWSAAARRRDALALRHLRESGAPTRGWREPTLRDSSPWTWLANAPKGWDLALQSCAKELSLAGVPFAEGDLRQALSRGHLGLADALEAEGALPDRHCPALCLQEWRRPGLAPDAPGLMAPDGRLVGWMLSGKVDIAWHAIERARPNSPTRLDGSAYYADPPAPWASAFGESCAMAPEPEREAKLRLLVACAGASELFAKGDPSARKALLRGSYWRGKGDLAHWIMIAGLVLAPSRTPAIGGSDKEASDQALSALLEAAAIGSCSPPGRARSSPPRSL